MSVLSDIADEAVRPIKTGVFVLSAVVVVGSLAAAANSKTGRKFLTNVKKAITSSDTPVTDEKKKEEKAKEVVIDVEPIPQEKIADETKKIKGEENA